MTDNHNGRKFALGALIAGAAGYIAGILTAPKSGKETRADLANKAEELKSEAQVKLEEARDELDMLIKNSKDKVAGLNVKAREGYNEAVVRAKDAKNKTVFLLKSVKNGESDNAELDKAIKQAKQAGKNLKKYFKD